MDQHIALKDLFKTQKLAGLATQSNGQPHNCLVAFACTDDTKFLLFATRRDTRKFQDILVNPPVSVLIDNRSNDQADFQDAMAVTAKGVAHEMEGHEKELLTQLYLEKHPYLETFIGKSDVALVRIEVREYLVARFDSTEVIQPV